MQALCRSMGSELERCRPWIEAALEYSGGTHAWDDIVAGIRSGHMQLWPGPRGCLVTEIVAYPRKRVLNVFLGGGQLEQLVEMAADVEAWALAQGCDGATIAGRPGWQRVFKGWRPLHVTLAREFSK